MRAIQWITGAVYILLFVLAVNTANVVLMLGMTLGATAVLIATEMKIEQRGKNRGV